MRAHRLWYDDGFTLVELLIAMATSGLILGAIFSFAMTQRQYLSTQEQVTQMQQAARATLDMLTHEIEIAGYNPTKAGFVGVTYQASQLQLKADLDGDGTTNGVDEQIIYTYDASARRILRNTGGSTDVLADQITAFTFAYLDAAGTPTTVSANIRQLQMTITARTAKPDPHYATNGGYRTYTLTSRITPRNLAYQ